jgi:hypothetical protein
MLLSVSAVEQEFVYLLNRARHDPVAYQAEENLPVDLSYVTPRGPLAVNDSLFESAEFHADEMATHNYFDHQSQVTGDWPNKMARDHGYPLPASWTDDANYIESLAAGTWYHPARVPLKELIVDEGIDPPGHRNHLLGIGSFFSQGREIGVGYAYRSAAHYDHYWAIHATWSDPSDTFLTGVVFDDVNGNQRYEAGEGLTGVNITVGAETTTTNAAGGWALQVGAGTHTVTASGGGFSGSATADAIVAGDNVEVDFISGQTWGMINFDDNAPPSAVDDAYSVDQDTTLTVDPAGVLANDSDPDNDPLTPILVAGPSHGTLQLRGDGSFDYTPSAGFVGSDGFTYRASDGLATSPVATVSITIDAVNHAPVATDDAFSVDQDTTLTVDPAGVLANDSDPDNDPLTAILVAAPSNGTLDLRSDGSFDYTPSAGYAGSDSFTYRAGDGSDVSPVATVTIDVERFPGMINFHDYSIDSYGGSQDGVGTVSVEHAGATLHMIGNIWKKIDFVYDVTEDTVLEFEFKNTRQGEIHGIGLDTDDGISANRTFQLYGTQVWGIQAFDDYGSAAPDYRHYRIPVGQYYTGPMNRVFFVSDQDVANPNSESFYRNVRIWESPQVDFRDYTVESYGGAQDEGGTVSVKDQGATLQIIGNSWKKIGLDYNVTENTVLEFDFKSDKEADIQGIGFDNDDALSRDRTFKVYGTQSWGISDFDDYGHTESGYKHYRIPVGQYYTGQMNRLFFVNDHDVANPVGESTFRNVRVWESPQIDFREYAVRSYGGSPDEGGTATIEDNGTTLHITGNLWKKIDFQYHVTQNTVLEFEFKSTRQGEIHGIGLDTDDSVSADRTFQLHGTQVWGIQDFDDYGSAAPGYKRYRIALGRYYAGPMNSLFFVNDHDVANPTGESFFRNVRVYES